MAATNRLIVNFKSKVGFSIKPLKSRRDENQNVKYLRTPMILQLQQGRAHFFLASSIFKTMTNLKRQSCST